MSGFSTYFFDLYGTLVDIRTDEQRPSLWRGTAEYLSLCGAVYGGTELRERYLALCADETDLLAARHPERDREETEIELRNVFRRLFEEKGVSVSDERIADTAVLFRALSFRRAPKLMKGVRQTLSELRTRGARVCLLSNAQSCFTIPELQRLGITDAFDHIFISSDFGCRKPSSAFFRAAMDCAGVPAREVLMVGNDPVADIRGADSVGMESRYIHTWQSPPRSGALPSSCREIRTLTDLLIE